MSKKTRIGVVNWDCSLPPDTFFGGYFSKSLSNKKWRNRTPYYVDIISEDNVCCHYRTLDEVNVELQYAIDAKIDYFAYVWHTDNKIAKPQNGVETSVTHPHAWTQDYVRKLHQQSHLSEKIKLCAILMCSQPYIESDFVSLAEAMKAPYYEKVDGRPLVFLYTGYNTDFIEMLREFPQKYGTEDPYIVFLATAGDTAIEGVDYSKADGVSAYAWSNDDGIDRYDQLIDCLLLGNEARKKFKIDTIPLFTFGWNPTPRIENPVPWYGYPEIGYHKTPTPAEIEDGAKRLADWIAKNKEYTKVGHVLCFAWNEFEEGAWICPTYDDDLNIDSSRVKVFSEIVKSWKQRLL